MQEYNRQLKERQRQLQAENDDDQPPDDDPYPTRRPPIQPQVEVHDDEDDFYGRSRNRQRTGENNHDQSVSSYRIRYQRMSRRQ
jgi:hypothetical protein